MPKITCRLLTFVVFLMVGATAFALPRIDKKLRPLLNTESNQTVTVIALFHDKNYLSRLEHSPRSHAQMEQELMANAKAAQASLMQKLYQAKESGTTIQAQSLWLFNAAILHVPASSFKNLAQNEDISALIADRPVHILDDGPGSNVSGKYTYGLEKINLPALREKAPNIDGAGVRVGILDTGIDATHPDLKDRVVLFRDFISSRSSPYDDNSHGTHVAGTISGGNASGTTIGIAPGVKLIVGKVFSSGGSASMSGLLTAMQWIADPDGNPQTNDYPQLVSNSWGGGNPGEDMDPMDEPLCKAIAGWVKLGILPVFAAGNSGPGSASVNLPGACPQALTVGATDANDKIASFSSRGPAVWKSGSVIKPTISAPGVKVISSVPGGGYKAYSGTSMATPHAAGVAALLIQAVPNISVEKIQEIMAKSATPLSNVESGEPNNDYGAGRIDAFNTIKNASLLLHGGQIERRHLKHAPEL